MHLSQLKYFRVLAETENLTKAAEKLFISAPALSNSIAKLEREVGATLFDRTFGKSLSLNHRGKLFLVTVNQMTDILDESIRTFRGLEMVEENSLTIATASPMLFQDMFMAFRRVHPDIMISHSFLNLNQLSNNDLLRQFNFVIASPMDISGNIMNSEILYDDDSPVLMVYQSHPFARRQSVDIQELRDEPFIALGKGLSSRRMFDEIFEHVGFEPKIVYECDHYMRGKLIQEEQGIGLSTYYTKLSSPNSPLAFVRLKNHGFQRSQALYWPNRASLTKLEMQFKDFALAFYQKLSCEHRREMSENI